MAVRGQLGGVHPLSLGQLRQPALGVVGLTAGQLVDGLDVGLQEAGEGDGAAAGREHAPADRPDSPLIRRLSVVPRASAICEATVRCQISS